MLWNYIFRINFVLKEISLIFCVLFHLAEKMSGTVSLNVLYFLNLTPHRKLQQLVHTDAKHSITCTLQFLEEYKHRFLTRFANI